MAMGMAAGRSRGRPDCSCGRAHSPATSDRAVPHRFTKPAIPAGMGGNTLVHLYDAPAVQRHTRGGQAMKRLLMVLSVSALLPLSGVALAQGKAPAAPAP